MVVAVRSRPLPWPHLLECRTVCSSLPYIYRWYIIVEITQLHFVMPGQGSSSGRTAQQDVVDIEVLKDVSRFESMEPGQDYVGVFQFLDEDQGVREVENLRRLRDGKIREYNRQQVDHEARLDRAKLEEEKAEVARERMRDAELMLMNYDAAIHKANIGLEVARDNDRVAIQYRQERGTKRREPAGGRGTPIHEPPSRGAAPGVQEVCGSSTRGCWTTRWGDWN